MKLKEKAQIDLPPLPQGISQQRRKISGLLAVFLIFP
jgi:hypothetical protein